MKPIPVHERLPEKRVDVLWYNATWERWLLGPFYRMTGDHGPGYFKDHSAVCYVCDCEVSHWMPLPPSPFDKVGEMEYNETA